MEDIYNLENYYKLRVREKKYFCLGIPNTFVYKHNLDSLKKLYYYINRKEKSLLISSKLLDKQLKEHLNLSFIKIYTLSQAGERGFIASAPKEWLKLINPEKGDLLKYELDLYENDVPKLIIKKIFKEN